MPKDKEIRALMALIDDPDDEVYETVVNKLINYGKEIILPLEQLLEVTPEVEIQSRIESLIHRVNFLDLQEDFIDWCNGENPELLRGAILLAKFQHPQLNVDALVSRFDQIRKNVWLELNNYLSPVEQMNVLNTILYSYYKLQGHELTERKAGHFFINEVLDTRQGNGYGIGVIYLALCESLDIPIFAIDIPRQFIFAYLQLQPGFITTIDHLVHKAQFYIDPISGLLYAQSDIDSYLKKINATERDQYFTPILNKQIMYKMMEELCLCYRYNKNETKALEIQQLMHLLVREEV